MSFTSYEFLLFFFIVLILYYILPKRCQWLLLLVASEFFYLAADPKYSVYLAGVGVVSWLTAYLIDRSFAKQEAYLKEHGTDLGKDEKKAFKKRCGRKRYRMTALCIVILLCILVAAKYTDFLIENINGLLYAVKSDRQISFLNLAIPLGISFYTFRAIGYVVDVYWRKIPAEHNFLKLALYLSFFPLIPQGPITNYGELSKTLYSEHRYDAGTIAFGLERILWGYFKKLVIADRILAGVSTIVGDPTVYQGAYAFVGMLFYTLELYADFTGGIDITIGVAQCFGIVVEENFDRPYFSCSLKEYWRRWHITMCNWFRTYVFYPVSISRPMQTISKFSRRHLGQKAGKRLPVYLSSFVVWLATGIWHGASWNFVVWGLANWLILMVSEELEPLYKQFHEHTGIGNGWGYHLFEMMRTFLLVCVLNLFDCYESVGTTLRVIISIPLAQNWNVLWNGSLMNIGLATIDYVIVLLGVLIMLSVSICKGKGSVREQISGQNYIVRLFVWFGLFLSVLLLGMYGIGYDASQFIYNQF